MSTDVLKQTAVGNATASIRGGRRFPHQIFVGEWTDYLFFYPEALFEARFIDVKDLILREESSSIIAVVNLGNTNNESAVEPQAIFLDRHTTPKHYIAELMGDRTAASWMFLMDRYVCASEKGNWSIYCEKENDVAVLAVGAVISRFTCSQLARLLNAKSIRSSRLSDSSQSFDFQRLVPQWKSALVAEYHPTDRSA